MLEDSFANRLKIALKHNNMKPSELSLKTGIHKSLISNYLSGAFKAKQDKVDLIAKTLDVSEAWLMGFAVDMGREWIEEDEIENSTSIEKKHSDSFDELELLFNKNKKILNEDDKETIKFLIEKRKREIDRQLNGE